MGLHFHGHGASHYKAQEREAIKKEESAVSPLDKVLADVERFILKAQVDAPMKQAKEKLDHEAKHFVEAVKAYKEIYSKAVVAPKAEPVADERKVLTTKPKP